MISGSLSFISIAYAITSHSDTWQGQLAHQHVFQDPKNEGITVDYFAHRTQTEVPLEIRQELGSRTLMWYYRLTTETQKEEAKARASAQRQVTLLQAGR